MEMMVSELQDRCANEQVQRDRFCEIEKMLVQVDYGFEDIRHSIQTTDTYIENYLPYKLQKQVTKLFLEVLSGKDNSQFGAGNSPNVSVSGDTSPKFDMQSANQELLLKRLDEKQSKAFYNCIISTNDRKLPKPCFKEQMIALDNSLCTLYPELFRGKNHMTHHEKSRAK